MIKALGKRVIVKVVDIKPKTPALLILPDGKDLITASVICFGEDVDASLTCGDIVYLHPHTGTEVKIKGENYLSIHEEQILAVDDGMRNAN